MRWLGVDDAACSADAMMACRMRGRDSWWVGFDLCHKYISYFWWTLMRLAAREQEADRE